MSEKIHVPGVRWLTEEGFVDELPRSPENSQEDFGDLYFDSALGLSNYTRYNEAERADMLYPFAEIVEQGFRPERVLDVGCAKGVLVKGLLKLGVDAYGVDFSPYAIEQALPEVKQRLRQGSVTALEKALAEIPGPFDLVLCLDTLEHLTEEQIDLALPQLREATTHWLVITVPLLPDTWRGPEPWPYDHLDKTHRTMATRAWWARKFLDHGLVIAPQQEHDLCEHGHIRKDMGLQPFVRQCLARVNERGR